MLLSQFIFLRMIKFAEVTLQLKLMAIILLGGRVENLFYVYVGRKI